MIVSKIHVIGLKPRKILQVKNLNTVIFQGEYGYVYDFDINSQSVHFLLEDAVYRNKNSEKDAEWIEEIERGFCGLILDYTVVNKTDIICCTSEGIVHWLSKVNNDWVVLHELRVTLDRLISLFIYNERLFLLSHVGDLYQIDISALRSFDSCISLSGIWDFGADEIYLYSGSADGKLSIYDKTTLTFLDSYILKAGWINAVHKGFLCTSTGAIYSFHREAGVSEVYYKKGKYWFNDLCIIRDTIVAVSAEGVVLCCDLFGNLVFQLKISTHQLISIQCSQDKLYIASVGGEIFIGQFDNGVLNIHFICKLKANITCIRISLGKLFAATTNGEICIIDLLHDGTIPLSNSNSLNMLSLVNSRIWKIAVLNGYVYGGSVGGDVFRLNIGTLSTKMLKTDCSITSLILNGDSIILGTREGNIHTCSTDDMKEFVPILKSLPYSVHKFCYEDEECSPDRGIVQLHISDRIDFNGRLINFLFSGQYVFKIEPHSSDEQITDIEWWKYPYITFGGKFFASGMLLDEFYKQHVIERLVRNVDSR